MRSADAQLDRPPPMKVTDRDDPVAPARRQPLEERIETNHAARTAFVECESVRRVQNHGYACPACGEPADEAALRCVGVNDLVSIAPQESPQSNQADQIPETDRAADYIDTDYAHSGLPDKRLHRRVGG